MKYKLDICGINELKRSFYLDYAFKYNKKESRFRIIFNNLSNKRIEKINETKSSIINQNWY
jgi:hypothetical protein